MMSPVLNCFEIIVNERYIHNHISVEDESSSPYCDMLDASESVFPSLLTSELVMVSLSGSIVVFNVRVCRFLCFYFLIIALIN